MGYATLSEFRSRLEHNLGNRGLAKTQLNWWVNDGYLDMCGAFDFEELKEVSTAELAAGADSITLPSDLNWVRVVKDDDEQNPLIKLSDENFWSILDFTETGAPERWTRRASILQVHPIPEEDLTLRILYTRIPEKLESDSDTTELNPYFDRAVVEYASYHALLDLGEETRAAEWLSRGMAYVRSRLLPQEFENDGVAMGVRPVTSWSQLKSL